MEITIDKAPAQLFPPAKAEEIAKALNADPDDDWTYTVIHAPEGRGLSSIEIADEDGEKIGKF